jgi:L-xylulokinase
MAGGAVNSVLWVQLFADILGIPIETIAVKELGALDCAMSVVIAAGEFKDYPEGVSAMVKIKQTVEPNREQGAIYRKKYEQYSAVCTALAGIWDKFSV